MDRRSLDSTCLLRILVAGLLAALSAGSTTLSWAQDAKPPAPPSNQAAKPDPNVPSDVSALPKGTEPTPLNREGTVLLDRKGGRVILRAEVVLREGMLEMLCCRKQTKEHESILSVDAKAYVIHTALVALGADPGTPVRFEPEFTPPRGPIIDIYLSWKDEKQKSHRVKAQSWIRTATERFYSEPLEQLPEGVTIPKGSELKFDARFKELVWFGEMSAQEREKLLSLSQENHEKYRKAIQSFYERSQPRPMTADWVFAGSGVYVDEKTGERFYQAEGGDLICVANFPSAMIDIGQKSSAVGEQNLLFAAFTQRIPPLGTAVTIELIPRIESKAAAGKRPAGTAPVDREDSTEPSGKAPSLPVRPNQLEKP